MLETSLRSHYQRALVDHVVKRLHHRVSPIHITVIAAILGVAFIPLLLTHHPYWAIACLLLSGYFDTVDGTLARHQNKTSDLGCVLDIMSDRLVEFSVVLAFYLRNPIDHGLMCILMLGSMLLCITSFLIVGQFTPNNSEKSFHYSPGIMERAEAFIFFVLMTLMPGYFNVLGAVFALLVLLTAVLRLIEFKKSVSS